MLRRLVKLASKNSLPLFSNSHTLKLSANKLYFVPKRLFSDNDPLKG